MARSSASGPFYRTGCSQSQGKAVAVLGGLSDLPVEPLLTQGTADRWEKQWAVTTDQTASSFQKQVDQFLETSNNWNRDSNGAWTFKDDQGRAWNGNAAVEPFAPGKLKLTMKIARRASRPDELRPGEAMDRISVHR